MTIKNSLLLTIAMLAVAGCSSKGFHVLDHNGKMYYLPENCSKWRYSYSNPDLIHCQADGRLTGITVNPADSQQIEGYRVQQQQRRELDEALESLNPKKEHTSCNTTIMGQVNCTTTTY